MSNKINLLAIVGQTASGKSGLAMQLAKELDGEIIAADSRTLYKGLTIGTAKPSAADIVAIPHHLVDIAGPDERVSAAQFKAWADAAIADIQTRGKLPILVGGSGLYIDSVLYNYDFSGADDVDLKLRTELNNLSVEELQGRIIAEGLTMPENRLNKRYLTRTLERGTAAPINRTQGISDKTLIVGIHKPKAELEMRIRERLTHMLNNSLEEEVRWAHKNYKVGSEPLKGNIYRCFLPYINQEKSLELVQEDIVKADLKLAKQQLSWFKRNQQINWFTKPSEAHDYVAIRLNN